AGPLEPAYYDLTVDGERTTLIAVPGAAYLPPILENQKAWGVAAQLYSLRSNTNWGIGDFGDLRRLIHDARTFGAATVAVNPLHQLHLTNPTSASPYSPNSRLFLDTLYLDVPDVAASLGLQTELNSCIDPELLRRFRRAELVDYAGVAQLKLRALRTLHAAFRKRHDARPHAEFAAFVAHGGPPLRLLAIYEALMKARKRKDPGTYGWLQWPDELREPTGQAVDEFARRHAEDVEFYEFLQWLADAQLENAVRLAHPMAIGLYRDLAVGVDANSADVWADRAAYCLNVCVGAPPDPLNPRGQNWALPPLDPQVLRARAYAPYIALLRANMRHAGALRIDHVMGLMRLFCIPMGATAAEGTYINYRFEEMLGILALESHRNRCMIVGEDLGTVPDGFRSRLAAARIFGCRLLYFEREYSGDFRPPEAYDRDVVASTGTNDVA
ncbi:MAG: 4-alpha-glucanotransferase, partial [Vulcanimicrobiaceae bacterium]